MKIFQLILFVAAIVMPVTAVSYAAPTDSNEVENQVKATYLYKFTNYIDWPTTAFSQPDTPFTIGVIGSDDIAAKLKSLIEAEGHMMNNRNIEVIVIKPNTSMTNIQILFIGKLDGAGIKSMLNIVQARPVLTITESVEGLDDGSIINFITDDNRVRFEVSIVHAERSGLKISARLLKVAKKVETAK